MSVQPQTAGRVGDLGGAGGAKVGPGFSGLLRPRWRGQPGRLEVWYATLSDPALDLGMWVHHELVSPPAGPAHLHGWAAVFPPGSPACCERFGPVPVEPGRVVEALRGGSEARFDPPAITGRSGRISWHLRFDAGSSPPLWTFPRWAWEAELLPAAQVVPFPVSSFSGELALGGRSWSLSEQARGAVARIYGRGNAGEWGWLHAGLGEGEVLEVVAARPRDSFPPTLPPLGFLQLRCAEGDWPRHRVLVAPLLHARLGLPTWSLDGTVGLRRLRVEVTLPAERSVSVGYLDPDGSKATCVNSEVASAEVVLESWRGRWGVQRSWTLERTAHAEVGTRP